VEDISSAILKIVFYQHFHSGVHPSLALQQAQNWLRNATYADLGTFYAELLANLPQEWDRDSRFFLDMETQRVQGKFDTIKEPPYKHPYYWAGFTLHGDSR
jgi:CHAT domain-containing protein